MDESSHILARHWREARASRFDTRRFEGVARRVAGMEHKAFERRLAFVSWARAQWAQQACPHLPSPQSRRAA